ncbi:MAG: low molecular weight phosphotyrosine protein phosphatase [Bacteroidetes bacterium]|nr:low molecular weight phosphotyrosine protein phosphatase [Bacteroidota bacterium]
MKYRILMVCLGNICRSPLAEGVLRKKLEQGGLADRVEVDSAGTSNYHIGETPDKRSVANARRHDVDISSLRARQFTASDFEQFDEIFVMDAENLRNVLKLAHDETHRRKTGLLLNELSPGSNRAVPDPYFGGEEGFENVFQLVNDACEAIVNRLQQQLA